MKKALFILLLVAATGCHKSDSFVPETEDDRIAVGFTVGAVSASASPASRADVTEVDLAVGTTVRVLAFERAATNADIVNDKRAGEATYVVVEEGLEDDGVTPKRVLKACHVDSATGAIDNTQTSDPDEIRLRADTYDFYAFTPAVAIAAPWDVSINHGVDHASSLTGSVEVKPDTSQPDPYTQSVELSVLLRKCAKVSFSFDRKSESSSIKKIQVKKVELSQIAHAPATSKLCGNLSIGANDDTYSGFPTGVITFPDDSDPVRFDCFDEVLPKSSGEYKLSLTLNFNDAAKDTTPEATITTTNPDFANVLEFVPGYHYNFKIVLKGNIFTLILQVGDWDSAPDWGDADSALGGFPEASIVVGQWEVEEKWDTDMGGTLAPTITVGGWTSSEDWGSDVGGFPSLSTSQTDQGWDSGADSDSDVGSSLIGTLDPDQNGNWNSGNTDTSLDLGAE